MGTFSNIQYSIDGEEWRKIFDFDLYQVSNYGRVRRWYKSKNDYYILKNAIAKGYLSVSISSNGIPKRYLVHRLVGIYFIDNPYKKSEINHINGIKTDNRVENLEWCTRLENAQHAAKNGLYIPYERKNNKYGKYHHSTTLIDQYTHDFKFIKTWHGSGDIQREMGIDNRNIFRACKQNYNGLTGGFRWRKHKETFKNKII